MRSIVTVLLIFYKMIKIKQNFGITGDSLYEYKHKTDKK